MSRRYRSFLVRCWTQETRPERIEIEQMQTGERARLPSLADLDDWIIGRLPGAAQAGECCPDAEISGGGSHAEEARRAHQREVP